MKPLDAIKPQAVDSRGHYRFVSTFQGARYTKDATQVVGTGSVTIVDFALVEYDPYSCVTTGAAWKYTVPRNRHGIYHVSAMVTFDSAAWDAGERVILYLYKGGAAYARLDRCQADAAITSYMAVSGGTDIKLAAAEYFDIRVEQDSGGNRTILNNALACWVSVHLAGQ